MTTDPRARRRWAQRVAAMGPGTTPDEWRRRHLGVVAVLCFHIVLVGTWAAVIGGPVRAATLVAPLLAAALVAGARRSSRGVRMVAATAGLHAASVGLLHLSDGAIEAHLHLFFVLGLVMVYEDLRPIVADAALVLVCPGLLGFLPPGSLLAVTAAQSDPLRWAVAHMSFVALTVTTAVVRWRSLEGERAKAEQVLDATGEGVYGLDLDGSVTFANRSSERLTGWRAGDLLGRHHHDVLRHTMPGAPGFERDECPTCAVIDAGTGDPVRDHEITRPDGTTFGVELRAHPIAPNGIREGTVVSFHDLSHQLQLVHQASHDPLTGLPNRNLLDDRLEQAIVRGRRGRSLTGCIFVDLDHFKAVNDDLGHEVGDRILVEAAARCRRAVRPGDTVARYGGDEFVVVCDGLAAPDDATAVARRLLDQFDAPFHLPGPDIVMGVSVGVAVGGVGSDATSLLRQADAAMYTAKRAGGGLRVARAGDLAGPTAPSGAATPTRSG